MKASRPPIRHGGRRRRERQEKVSPCPPPAASAARARGPASAFVRGTAFLCLPFSPLPSLPQPRGRAPPLSTSPSWRGGRETLQSASRGRGLGPARPPALRGRRGLAPPSLSAAGSPLAPTPIRVGIEVPRLEPRAREPPPPFVPELPLLPAPILSVSIERSAPGGPRWRVPAPEGASRSGFPAEGPAGSDSRAAPRRRRRGPCLCAGGGLPRRPETLTFFQCARAGSVLC